jgi:Tfp pilus assembly protein PilO
MARKGPEAKKTVGSDRLKGWIAEHLMPASLGAFILTLLLGYLFVYAPELKRIKEANVTRSLEQERELKDGYYRTLQELRENFESFDAEDRSKLSAMVPPEIDVPGLLAALEATALSSDISLSAVNIAKGEASSALGGLGTVDITLSLEHGSYERFKLFVESLAENLRLFDIRSAAMNPAAASYSVTLRAYIQSGQSN